MKTPYLIGERIQRGSRGLIAAATFIAVTVPLWGQAPVLLTTNHAAILSWEQSDTTYILTESPTVDGLYTPSLLPIIFGGSRVAVVTSESPMKFFNLAQGGQGRRDHPCGRNPQSPGAGKHRGGE